LILSINISRSLAYRSGETSLLLLPVFAVFGRAGVRPVSTNGVSVKPAGPLILLENNERKVCD
jgi:hypothetical protein